MKLVNNTHYYSINNRCYNVIPDTDSWQFQCSKRLSYSQRLYWEYKYIKSCGGQAFFYTFTYNDDNLPYFEYDKNVFDEASHTYTKKHIKTACFNYSHIRLLTNGIISKVLRRKFGSQLRYFVACERGEGKGKHRAKGQNPHYHVIFFISPLPPKVRKPHDTDYKRISPIQFCHLCKCVWQYNSTPNKYDHLVADYKSARFGHCQPGDDVGLITDFDALSYVSKYVCKDSLQVYDDLSVRDYYIDFFKEKGYTYHSLYSFYLYLRFNGSVIDRKDFLEYSKLGVYIDWRSQTGNRDVSWPVWYRINYDTDANGFFNSFSDYFSRIYLPQVSEQAYRDYCNKFGAKVRTSKSLGIYGLQFVEDPSTNPHFTLNKSDEVVNQPICLYYYRKLYMNVVKCPHSGNNLYVLNEDGLNLKCLFLRSALENLKRKVYESLDFIDSNITSVDILSEFESRSLKLDDYRNLRFVTSLDSVIERFVVYRFIYQYRNYDEFDSSSIPALNDGFCYDNYLSDYRRFLQSNFYTCDYTELCLLTLIENYHFPYIRSFSCHTCFSSYIGMFKLLQSYLELYIDYMSELKKKKFAKSIELRQIINAYKYNPLVG